MQGMTRVRRRWTRSPVPEVVRTPASRPSEDPPIAPHAQDEERWRPRQPAEPPARLGSEPAVRGVAEQLRGVERREVGAVMVVGALKRRPVAARLDPGRSARIQAQAGRVVRFSAGKSSSRPRFPGRIGERPSTFSDLVAVSSQAVWRFSRRSRPTRHWPWLPRSAGSGPRRRTRARLQTRVLRPRRPPGRRSCGCSGRP